MSERERGFLAKAEESLASAEDDFAAGRHNSCANRCYYACFQAAITALVRAGIIPVGQWGHDFVQARFVGDLINRRHRYPSELRDTLPLLFVLRQQSDYEPRTVSKAQADRALRRARRLVSAVRTEE